MIYDPIASIDWDKFKKKLSYFCPSLKYDDDEVLKLIIETYLYEIMGIGDIDIYPVKHTQDVRVSTDSVALFSFPVAAVDKITSVMDESAELSLSYLIKSNRFLDFDGEVNDICIFYQTQIPEDTFQRLIVNDLLFDYINYKSQAESMEGVKSKSEGNTTLTYFDNKDTGGVSSNSLVIQRIKALRTSQARVVFF